MKKRIKILPSVVLFSFILMLTFFGCSNEKNSNAEEFVIVKDMFGSEVSVRKNPQKIACVSRNTYDFFIAFGLGDKIDGVYEKVLENEWVKTLSPSQTDYFSYEYSPSAETFFSRDVDIIFSPEEYITLELRSLGLPAMTVSHYGSENGFDDRFFFIPDLVLQLWGEDKGVVKKVEYWKKEVTQTIEEVTATLNENGIEEGKSIHYVRADKADRGLTYTENTKPYLEYIYRLLKIRTIGQDLESNNISVEELLARDPDYIVIGGIYQNGAVQAGLIEPLNNLTAVKEGKVFTIPVGISQFEQPSSIASVFIKDQANKLYPSLFNYDIATLTKESYETYFGVELTDTQVDYILQGKNPSGQYE